MRWGLTPGRIRTTPCSLPSHPRAGHRSSTTFIKDIIAIKLQECRFVMLDMVMLSQFVIRGLLQQQQKQ